MSALVSAGADLNVQDKKGLKGNTALILASMKGQLKIVDKLLSGGADLNAKNIDGHTALILASIWGRLEVAKALLAAGAELNKKSFLIRNV